MYIDSCTDTRVHGMHVCVCASCRREIDATLAITSQQTFYNLYNNRKKQFHRFCNWPAAFPVINCKLYQEFFLVLLKREI